MQEQEVEEFASADVAYDVAMRRLEEQMRQIDHIDTKVAVVMATASGIAAIFASVAVAALRTASTWPLLVGAIAVAVVGGVFLAVTHEAFGAYRLYSWSLRPEWSQLLENSRSATSGLLKSWVAASCVASLEENQPNIGIKLHRLWLAYRLLEYEAAAALAGILAIMLADRFLT